MKIKKTFIFTIMTFLLLLTSCSSLNTVIKKRNLQTQTKLSETIWLDPSLIGNKTVFLQIKNTSTKSISIESGIKNLLLSKGYKLTTNPKTANYWLQVNVLKLDKQDLRDSNPAEAGLVGAGIGATLGAYNTGSANTAVGLGLLGGLAGVASDALVEDIYYIMITDLIVSERTTATTQSKQINLLTQGTRGITARESNTVSNLNKYQTRVVSTANKVNLNFAEAKPVLEQELINSIGNIF